MVLVRIPDAVNDSEVAVFSFEHFFRNDFLGLSVEASPLWVADHNVMNLVVFDVVCSNLTSESTLAVSTHVLSANQNAGIYNRLHKRKMEESRQYHNVCNLVKYHKAHLS